MKLVIIKRNFQILLVPNYRAFRITVKLSSCLIGTSAQNQSSLSMQELIELLNTIKGRSNFFLDTMRLLRTLA